MPLYRVTVRHGRPQQYVVEDIEADTVAEAMAAAARRIDVARRPDADLVEIRVQTDPDSRQYTGG